MNLIVYCNKYPIDSDEENDGDAPTTLHAANSRALDALQPIERFYDRVISGAILPPAEADQVQSAFVNYLDALSSLMQIQNRHDEIDAANTVTGTSLIISQSKFKTTRIAPLTYIKTFYILYLILFIFQKTTYVYILYVL